MSKGGGDASAASGQAMRAASSMLPLAAAAAIAVVAALAGVPFLDGMAPAAHAQQYDNGDCAPDPTDCIFRFTDTPVMERPGTGQFGESLIRFDPAGNRLYIAYDNVVAVYNASSPGRPLMFNATFPGGPGESIDAMEVNTRTGDLYVATRIGGYQSASGTTYLFKMNSSGSVSNVTITTPYFNSGAARNPAPLELRVDSERSLVYMSTAWPRGTHGIENEAGADGIVVVNATDDPPTYLSFGVDVNDWRGVNWRNTFHAWFVSSMAVNSTAVNHTIVYAMAYYFDGSASGLHRFQVGLVTLWFNGGGGGIPFNQHYTQIDEVQLKTGDQNAKNDWALNAYDMVLDDRNDKLFVLMEQTGVLRWYDLKNRTSGPNGLPTLGGTLEATSGFNRDLVLDEGRGLLYWFTSDSVGVYRTSDGVRLAVVDRPGVDNDGYPGQDSAGYVYAKGHAAAVDAVPASAAIPAGVDAGDIDTGIVYALGPKPSNLAVIDPRPESAPERLAREVADGGTVAIPDGMYRDVYLSTGAGGAEKAMTIRPASGEAGGVVFTGASHIRVRNGDVAVQGIVFRDTTCHDKLEDADRAGGYLPDHVVNVDADAARIANVTITDSVFENTCYGAILSGGLDGPGSGNASDVAIRNNTFRDIGYNARHHGGVPEEPRSAIRTGVYSGGVQMQNATISSNTFERIAGVAVDVRQARNITVSNNAIADTPHSAIRIHGGSDGVEVRGNTIANASYAPNFDYLRGVDGSAALAQDAAILVVPDDGGLLGRTGSVNATGNDISRSGGAFSVCGAVCEGNRTAGYATTIGSDVDSVVGPGGQDMRFNWNTLRMDNGGDRLVENGVRGALDARYNYYPGYEPAAGLFRAGAQASGNLPAGSVLHRPLFTLAPDDPEGPSVLRVTSDNASGSYAAGDSIDIAVEFTKPVSVSGTPVLTVDAGPVDRGLDMVRHDASVMGFRYAVAAGDSSPVLEYANRSSLSAGGGIDDMHLGIPASLALPALGSPESLSARGLVIGTPDTTAPTVRNVTSESPDAVYGKGELVEVQVVFSEAVYVSTEGGTPRLMLDAGRDAGSPAAYASGSGTETLVFEYRPADGDRSDDLDYTNATALELNGGTIRDRVRNDANLALAEPGEAGSLGSLKDIEIDAVPPLVDGSVEAELRDRIRVTFDEPVASGAANASDGWAVSGQDAGDLSLYHRPIPMDEPLLEIVLELDAHLPDTAPDMALSYNGSIGAIVDVAGNPLRSVPETSVADRLRPEVDEALIAGPRNATIDYTEPVTASQGAYAEIDIGGAARAVDPYSAALALARHALGFAAPDAPVPEPPSSITIDGRAVLDEASPPNALADGPVTVPVLDGRILEVHSSRITGPGEVVVKYTVNAAAPLNAYGSLVVGGQARDITGLDGGGGDGHAHTLTFDPPGAPPDATGSVNISGSAVVASGSGMLLGDGGAIEQNLGDGRSPSAGRATAVSQSAIRVEFDEPIVSPGAGAAGWSVRGGDAAGRTVASSQDIAASGPAAASLDLFLDGPLPDTAPDAITLSYRPAAGGSVEDAAGNGLVASSTSILDGIAPRVEAGSPVIAGPNTVEIRYTERVWAHPGAYASVALSSGGGARSIVGLEGNGTAVHTVSFGGAAGERGATGMLAMDVLAVRDAAQNPLDAASPLALADDQPPSVSGATAVSLDTIRVEFNAPVVAAGAGAAGWSVRGGDAENRTVASSADVPASAPSDSLELFLDGPLPDTAPDGVVLSYDPAAGGSVEDPAGRGLVAAAVPVGDGIVPVIRFAFVAGPHEAEVRYAEPVWAAPGAYASVALSSGGGERSIVGLEGNGTAVHTVSFGGDAAVQGDTGRLKMDASAVRDAAQLALGPDAALVIGLAGEAPPAQPGGASARAAFTAANTVTIDYSAPLGPPAGHAGPVYTEVTIDGGGGGGGEQRPVTGAEGLGTAVHTVTFGGDGVGVNRTGTITLAVGLEGRTGAAGEGGGGLQQFAAGDISVASGLTVQTVLLAQPQQAQPVRIEPDGFTRAVDGTAPGRSARLAINVSGLAGPPGMPNAATFPAEAVTLTASFAEVTFPPGVVAQPVPPGGVFYLYADAREPPAEDVASSLGHPASGGLILRTIVEVGGDQAPVAFDMPVRVQLEGQAAGRAFYIEGANGTISPIDLACAADDTERVHRQLGGMGECRIDSADGEDMVIHTYHLTRFGTAASERGTPPPVVHTCSLRLDKTDLAADGVLGSYSKPVRQAVVNSGSLPFDRVALDATPWRVDPAPGGQGAGAPPLPASLTVTSATAQGGEFAPLPAGIADGLGGGQEEALWLAINLTGHAQVNGTRLVQDVAYTAECAG